MRLFNINFLKNKKITLEEQNDSKKYDQYVELGKLIKEARTQNNLSVKELSNISKIPESSINSIENNIAELRPRNPFLRSILLKLEKCLSLENNTLVGLEIREANTFEKNKKKIILRKFDFLNSWQVSFFYFLFLILILFFLNRYFISNVNIIEIQIIEEKGK
ncbi:helix-turn-helix domain-containing protein [Prochlorococcus sp. AH-716-P20]|nr:helix-turn-helix domain-containing protein [Prochlorococcus sp. AH-716-P20]MDC3028821.1 helix-turn-helix domain-containing protein [Prochlorococcus sp. AH-716-P20]